MTAVTLALKLAAEDEAAYQHSLEAVSDRCMGVARLLQRAAFAGQEHRCSNGMAGDFTPGPLYVNQAEALFCDPAMAQELAGAVVAHHR